jgi:tetratricopeptide (TPR) repeat protein
MIHVMGEWGAMGFVVVLGLFIATALASSRASGGVPEAARGDFDRGNGLYGEGRYMEALAAYREILVSGYASTELYLNLGNAAYKAGDPGWAIYYYTLAQRSAPRDPDIRSNLNLVRREALGDEPAMKRSTLLDAAARLRDTISSATAARTSSVLLWIACGALVLSWTSRLRGRAGQLRWIVLWCLVAATTIASVKWAEEALFLDAVTVQPAAAHAEPSEGATVEFRLPPGSPVNLGRRTPGWREVIVSSSLRGWVPDANVAALASPR